MATKERGRRGRWDSVFGNTWRKIAGWFEEPSVSSRARRSRFGSLLQLEERALLSASAIDPEIQEALAAAKAAQAAKAQPESFIARHEVAFVDSAVHEFQSLVEQLNRAEATRQLDVVVLDGNRNGIEQITQTLAGYQNLDAVHFLSHGRDGAVKLGSVVLDGNSLQANAGVIATWKAALGENADLLFYGCNLAEGTAGQGLMTSLASLTGADVAASTDITGHESKGGDWTLEFSIGIVETPVALDSTGRQNWDGVLAPPTANDDSYSVNEDNVLTVSAPGVLGNDTDPDLDPLTAILVSGPSNGNLTFNADGSFSYTPNADFNGTDSFTYRANDGTVNSNVATVTITVNAVIDPLPQPVGSEFRVNTYTTDIQGDLWGAGPQTVAMDQNGNFVVVWESNGQDGGNDGIYGQRYNSAGVAQGSEFRVNTYTADDQWRPSVAMDPSGNFVVTWSSWGQDGAGSRGVYGQRYSAAGVAQGAEFRVNTTTAGDQEISSVAMDSAGNFVITWTSYNQDASNTWGIYAQRYDASGVAQGSEFLVNTTTADDQQSPCAAIDSAGNFVITWTSYNQDASNTWGVYAQRYDASGVAQGSEFLVNTTTADDQRKTALDMDGSGNFVVTWQSNAQDGSGLGIYAQRYNASGVAQGSEFRANTTTAGDQQLPSISLDGAGKFVITWQSYSQDAVNTDGIYAQYYDALGVAQGAEFLVNTTVAGNQHSAGVAMATTSHEFVIKWSGNGPGDADGVFAQLYDANAAPLAAADSYTTNEDTALVVGAPGVLANDTDSNGDAFTATLVAGPANGILTFNADGSFTYTPSANFNGTDSFTYKANDSWADSNVATVTITVNAVNDAPVNAMPGAQTVNEDAVLTLSGANRITISDVDNSGGTAVFQMTLTATNGTLTLNGTTGLTFTAGDGTSDATMTFSGARNAIHAALNGLTFTPTANYNGAATLTVTTSDLGNTGAGGAQSDTDVLSITVNPVNDAPVAVADFYSVNEDNTLNAAAPGVLTNDSDVDGDPLTAVLVSGPSNGSLTLNADGSFSYTPNANFNGTDSFTYKANDGTADSNIATVNITVNPINDAPVASADSYSVNEDTVLNVASPGVLSNDSDVDGNPLTAVLVSGASNGGLTLNANGSFTYTPTTNFNGSDSFTYKANDGALDSSVVTVTLTVNPVNDAPVAVNDSYSINEDNSLIVAAPGVLSNDTDIENNSLTATLVAAPSNGAVVLNPDGSFTYIPNANFTGTDSFTYKANDGSLDSNVATVTITVDPVNDAPIHNLPQTQVTLKNTALTFSTANANPITVSDDSGSNPVRMTLSIANGTLTLSQTTGLSFTTGGGSADETMVFTGSVANINAALEGMIYTPTTNYVGITNLQVTTDDLGNSGAGGPLTTTTNLNIEVVVEFIVNTTLTEAQTLPSAGINPLGQFVVAWTTNASGSLGVRAQRFAADGTPQGGQIQVNQITVNDQTRAAVAMDVNAGFVVVFSSKDTDGNGWGIYGQRFSAAGAYIGPEFRVNTTTNGDQDNAAIAMDAAGNFVVVWQSDRGGTGKDIYYQRYDFNGIALGGEVRVNTTITKDQEQAAVAMAANGNFVVTWQSKEQDGSGAGVFARAFDSAGNPLTGEFQANTNNSGSQDKPAIAMAPNGDFVIAWVSGNNQDGNGRGVFAQRFAADTTRLGGEFQVNTYTQNDQDWPTIAMDGAGNFTIVWSSNNQDGNNKGVYSQKYDALGNAIGLETRLNSTISGDQTQPTAAMSTFGDLIVAWQGKGPGDDTGIFGQHYRTDNDPPVNNMPGNRTTNEDTQLVFSTANGNVISIADPDSGNYPMQVTLTVANGTLTLSGVAGLTFSTGDGVADSTMVFTGSRTNINAALDGLTFTPTLNWNGFTTLTITSNDQGYTGQGGPLSDTDSINIGVNPVNDAPVAVGEAYSVNEDNTLNVAASGVLANDSDVENSPLTAVLVSAPSHGSLTLNADGSFSYTPNLNFNGADSFTYKANDGNLDSNVVTVNLTVNAVNDAPVHNLPGLQSTNEDTPLVFSAANGNAISIADVDVGGGQVQVTLTVTNGVFTLGGIASLSFSSGDGVADTTMTFTGMLADVNAALEGATFSPNLNYNGPATLTIATGDQGNTGLGGSLSDSDVLNITVNPVNDAPLALPESYSTNEDTPLVVAAPGVLGNDTDVENTPLNAVLVSGPSSGGLVLDADGSFVYTPSLNFNGVDSFTYKANDGAADSNVVAVTITIIPVNDAPVAGNDSYSTNEDIALSVSAPGVLADDTDVENSPLIATLVSGPSNGSLTFNPNGSFDYTPNLNFNGVDTFTYRANDGTADSNVATVTITVNPVNDAPVAAADSYVVNEDTALVIGGPGVLSNDFDVDRDPLSAVLVSGTSNGTLALQANGSFVYTPNANFNGADSFSYKVSDGAAYSNVATVDLTISAVNDVPLRVAGSVNNLTVMQGSGLTPLGMENLQYSPGGGNDEAGQVLTFMVTAVPDSHIGDVVLADGVTVVSAGTSYTLDELRGMQFRAAPGGVGGPLNFSFVAQDSGGTTNAGADTTVESLKIVVQPIPPAPTGATPPPPPPSQPDADKKDPSSSPAAANAPVPEAGSESEFHAAPVPQAVNIALESGAPPERRVIADNGGASALMNPAPSPVRSSSSDAFAQFQVFEPLRIENAPATGTAPAQLGLGITSTTPFMMAHPQFFWNQLSELAQQFEPENWERLANVTFLTGLSVSAGYLLWNVRTWYLLASLLLSRPLWQEFDHLAVLDVWYSNPNNRRYLLGWEEDEEEEKTLGGVMS